MILTSVLIENRISYFDDIYFLTLSKMRICIAGRVMACAMCVVHSAVILAARTCSAVRWVRPYGTFCCEDIHWCARCTVPPDERIFTAVRDIQYLLLLECDVYSRN